MNQKATQQGVGGTTLRFKEVMGRIGSRPALIHAAAVGDYFGESAPYRAAGNLAVVDVVGPLLNESCDCGGCTCYADIQEQLRAADANPNIKGILLNVNSPGGQTDNAFETAALIAEIAKRTEVWACASTSAYSAAYLLASQANRIYCSPVSGGVGSIGVFCTHFDLSGALEGAGIKVTLVSAGKGKTDGNPYEPLSETALADMKQYVGYLYGEFVGAISRGRGLATAGIVNMGARCFAGAPAAISSGLADVSGDLSKALNDMGAEIQRMPLGSRRMDTPRVAPRADQEQTSMGTAKPWAEIMTEIGSISIAGRAVWSGRASEQARAAQEQARPASEAELGRAKPWAEVLVDIGCKAGEGRDSSRVPERGRR